MVGKTKKQSNKKNNPNEKKKLIVWEGFRKELPWILFWGAILIMGYGYFQDKKICNEVLADPCGTCYELNQTIKDYPLGIEINESLLDYEDTNPNGRTISNYGIEDWGLDENFRIEI